MMKRAVKQIAVLAAILLAFCVVCRLVFFKSYTAYIRVPLDDRRPASADRIRFEAENPQVLHAGEPQLRNTHLRVPIRGDSAGQTFFTVTDEKGNDLSYGSFRVGRFGTVYDESSGGFTGDTAVLIAECLFFLAVSAIMVWNFFQAKGCAFYSYATMYFAGFSLFALMTGVLLTAVTVRHLADPLSYPMMAAYSVLNSASRSFVIATSPVILVFALAMGFSNAALLRHERLQGKNLLGLGVSLLLILGEAVCWYFFTRDFSGSEQAYRLRSTAENVCATVFVYFECMLAGSVICGVRAARHIPAQDKDYIVILGCYFRKDGTLPPLLRGRVDRAVSFWKDQKEATGREACFIPSGGQGRNEPMPEAEAMRRYLLSRGIPDRLIRVEDRSRNTYQNMAFSKKIIDGLDPQGKTMFATTNYHVFRSGVWAAQAGLKAEGVGSRTVWWYWPNAFMREVAGLIKNRWKEEVVLLLSQIAFFSLLTLLLS